MNELKTKVQGTKDRHTFLPALLLKLDQGSQGPIWLTQTPLLLNILIFRSNNPNKIVHWGIQRLLLGRSNSQFSQWAAWILFFWEVLNVCPRRRIAMHHIFLFHLVHVVDLNALFESFSFSCVFFCEFHRTCEDEWLSILLFRFTFILSSIASMLSSYTVCSVFPFVRFTRG